MSHLDTPSPDYPSKRFNIGNIEILKSAFDSVSVFNQSETCFMTRVGAIWRFIFCTTHCYF